MKRNVDLTEDLKFDKVPIRSVFTKDIFGSNRYVFNRVDNFTPQGKTMILTGTAWERSLKRSCDEFCKPIGVCDCCGTSVRMPWRWGLGGLCKRCDEKNERGIRL